MDLPTSATTASSTSLNADYGFISLLGLAQRLGVNFLPLTWQAARGALNSGGQAKIYELHVSFETSFAFKRFGLDQRQKQKTLSEFIHQIVSELLVLTHEAIRDHPYIARLEGLCWDVRDDDDIRPVLVMEKSHFGDLYQFMRSGLGRDLCMSERLRLCVDIGIAVQDMHANSK